MPRELDKRVVRVEGRVRLPFGPRNAPLQVVRITGGDILRNLPKTTSAKERAAAMDVHFESLRAGPPAGSDESVSEGGSSCASETTIAGSVLTAEND